MHTSWQCHVCIHNQMLLIFNAWVFLLRIKRVQNCVWNEKEKNEKKNLPTYHRPELPSHIRFFFFKFAKMSWNFFIASEPSTAHVQGRHHLSVFQQCTISLCAPTSRLVCHSSTPTPPPPILKFLAKERSVKTGYLYFYWFLQTMTTLPERQCQET